MNSALRELKPPGGLCLAAVKCEQVAHERRGRRARFPVPLTVGRPWRLFVAPRPVEWLTLFILRIRPAALNTREVQEVVT